MGVAVKSAGKAPAGTDVVHSPVQSTPGTVEVIRPCPWTRKWASTGSGSGSEVPVRILPINVYPDERSTTTFEIIAGIDEGVYISTPNSWSIDDNREGFRLGGEIGWLIKNGRLAEMVKTPAYSGNTVDFWNSCDAIGNQESWRIWGTPNCGKGQPGQNARTAQGAAPCRFRKVKIG